MALTREDIAQMRLAAEMCDDYSQWKREMAEVRRLEAELDRLEGKTGAPTPQAKPYQPIPKRPAPGIHCKSIEEALAVMDRVFGLKKDNREAAA